MLAVRIDLGGTPPRAAPLDPGADAPRPLSEERFETGATRTPAEVADLVARAVDRVCQGGTQKIAGVGIGIAAMLRGTTGVIANAPNLGWREVDFRSLLRA